MSVDKRRRKIHSSAINKLCCSRLKVRANCGDNAVFYPHRAAVYYPFSVNVNYPCVVKINIKKGIPLRSGLGGGSSDAAAVINALNKILKLDAPAEVLEKVAAEVGADVPFFIRGGMQRADGIGEKLTPVKCDFRPYFIVAAPAKGAATDEVYAKFDEIDPQRSDGTGKILHAMSFELNPYDFLSNSLLPAATALVPEIEDVLTKLSATSTMVNMTGSGSAVFGLFDRPEKAESLRSQTPFIFSL